MRKIIAREWEINKWFRLWCWLPAVCLILWLAVLAGGGGESETAVRYEGEEAGEVILEDLTLERGIYDAVVSYQAEGDGSYISLEDGSGSYGSLECNEIPLSERHEQSLFSFRVKGRTDKGSLTVHQGENAALRVVSVEIRQTKKEWARVWWTLLWLSLGVWLLWAGASSYRRGELTGKGMLTAVGLGAVWLTVSVPIMGGYLLSGADLVFHLLRIEGLKEGLISGQLPVRIQPTWLDGYGYATSVFYGDFFLSLPALMRLSGFSVQEAYLTFLMVINLATVLIAYHSFRGMFGDPAVGLLGSMLYTWSPYRIYDLYGRAALGETLAMTFLPLLCYGFYRIFTEDEEKKGYGRLWIWPVLAFTGIIQSHILTCEMTGVWVILLCILFWRRVIRPRVFGVLAGAALLTALVNLWFLAPFLDYYMTGDFYVHHIQSVKTQHRAPYLLQYLFAFFRSGISAHFNENGMVGSESLGIGFGMTLCLLGLLWILFTRRYQEVRRKEACWGFGLAMAAMGTLFMILGTNQFPWDLLQKKSTLAAVFISSLQFPMRLLTMSSLCFCAASCMVVRLIRRYEKPRVFWLSWICLAGVTWLTAQFLLGDVMQVKDPIWLYNAENMGTATVVGGEYLPASAVPDRLVSGVYEASDQVVIQKQGRTEADTGADADQKTAPAAARRLEADFRAVNTGDGTGWVEVPLLYYKGYRAVDVKTGRLLTVGEGETGKVRIELEPGYEGSVHVEFVPPRYWRAAEAASLVTIVGSLVGWLLPGRSFGRRDQDGKKTGDHHGKRGK